MVILYIKIQNKYKVGSVVGGILGKGGGVRGRLSKGNMQSNFTKPVYRQKLYPHKHYSYEAELIIEMHCFLLGYV